MESSNPKLVASAGDRPGDSQSVTNALDASQPGAEILVQGETVGVDWRLLVIVRGDGKHQRSSAGWASRFLQLRTGPRHGPWPLPHTKRSATAWR